MKTENDCIPFDDSAGQLAELCQKLERERDEARNLADAAMWEADRVRSKLEKLVCERDEARLQYSTTLVFCQSLVKERLEEWRGRNERLDQQPEPLPMAKRQRLVDARAALRSD